MASQGRVNLDGQHSKIFQLTEFSSIWCYSLVFILLHCRSQTEGISSHRKYNPFKSKVIMALYALLSCIMRATALVIYVVLTLGILDVLRHLQGSQDTISIQKVLALHILELGNEYVNQQYGNKGCGFFKRVVQN